MAFQFSLGGGGFNRPSPRERALPTPGRDTLFLTGADDVLARALSTGEQALFDRLVAEDTSRVEAFRQTLTGGGAIFDQLLAAGLDADAAAALIGEGGLQRPLTATERAIFAQLVNAGAILTGLYGPQPAFANADVAPAEALGLVLSGQIRRPFEDANGLPLLELVAFADLRSPPPDLIVVGQAANAAEAIATVPAVLGSESLATGPDPAPNEPPSELADNAVFGGSDSIFGNGGDDVIVDLLGDNSINTDRGDDEILLGEGNDRIYDLGGNNVIVDLGGNNSFVLRDDLRTQAIQTDIVTTGDGDDRITAFNGRNEIDAGGGNNIVRGGDGFDRIRVGLGDDYVDVFGGTLGETEESILDLGAFTVPFDGPIDAHNVVFDLGGSDTFRASANPVAFEGDTVFNGNDFVLSDFAIFETGEPAFGDDLAVLGAGDNVFVDTGGDNTVTTGSGADSIFTSLVQAGADTINAGAGNDTISTGGGSDRIRGGGGGDRILEAADGVVDTLVFATEDLDGGVDVVTGLELASTGPGTAATLLDLIDLSLVEFAETPVTYDDYLPVNFGASGLGVALDLDGDDAFDNTTDVVLAVLADLPSDRVLSPESFLFADSLVA